jgi:hypothetical protein
LTVIVRLYPVGAVRAQFCATVRTCRRVVWLTTRVCPLPHEISLTVTALATPERHRIGTTAAIRARKGESNVAPILVLDLTAEEKILDRIIVFLLDRSL